MIVPHRLQREVIEDPAAGPVSAGPRRVLPDLQVAIPDEGDPVAHKYAVRVPASLVEAEHLQVDRHKVDRHKVGRKVPVGPVLTQTDLLSMCLSSTRTAME